MKNRHSLRFQIWFSFLMISGVFACIVLGTTFYISSDFYSQQMTADAKNQIQRVTTMLDNYITELKELQNSMIYSQYENEYLIAKLVEEENGNNEITDYEELLDYRKFISLVRNNMLNNRHVDGAYLICKNGQIFSSVTPGLFLEKQYQDSDWYEEVISSGSSQKIFLYYDTISKTRKLLICKRVMGLDGYSQGIFILIGNLSDIENFCSQYENEYYDLMDEKGEYIFTSIPEEYNFKHLLEKAGKAKNQMAIRGGTIVAIEEMEDPQWTIIFGRQMDTIFQVYLRNCWVVLLWILFLLVFSIHFLRFLDRKFTQPITNLAMEMRKVPKEGFLVARSNRTSCDEIKILYNEYEKMITEIDSLISNKYIMETTTLKIKLKMLLSQINAHFVFNTLENINSIAEIEGKQEIVTMSKCLGDLLRYSIHYNEDEVLLEQEVEQALNYLEIEKIRFDCAIDVQKIGIEQYKEHKIMKFILQPIIENSIEHGFTDKPDTWKIVLSAEEKADAFIIRAADNGCGVSPNIVEQMNQEFESNIGEKESDVRQHIGLRNINMRIKLLYGMEYGLHVESREGESFTVEIKVPWRDKNV